MIQSKRDSSLIFVATSRGPKIRKYDDKQSTWVVFDSIKGISEDANSVAEDKNGNVWFSTILNGIYKIDPSYKTKHYDTTDGFKTMIDPCVFSHNGDLLVGTPNGIYKHTPEDKFVPFSDFGEKYSNGKTGIFRIFKGLNNTNWLCLIRGKKKWIEAIKQKENTYESDSISFMRTFYKTVPQPVNTFSFDSLRVVFEQPEDMIPILDYKFNNLKFYYSCPFYEDEASTVFSYFLEGNDEGWSKWTKETKAI